MTAIKDTAGSPLPAEEATTLTEQHRIVVCDTGVAYCECESGEVTQSENGDYECSKYRLMKFLVSG